MSKELKRFQITFKRGDVSEIGDSVVTDLQEPSEEEERILESVGATVRAYLKAVEELLGGKYAHLKEFAPVHLTNRGKVVVLCCPEGVIVRYERKLENETILCGWVPEGMPKLAGEISENVIHCYYERSFTSTVPTSGIELKFFVGNAITKKRDDICSFRIGFDAVIEQPKELPKSPHKPYCLLSVNSSLEIQTQGVLVGEDEKIDEGQRFLSRSEMRLPVGWECIEIYPFFQVESWKPEYAYLWAEKDLLGAIVTKQFQEKYFQSLDPKASARRCVGKLLKDYKELLDSNPEREEVLQAFLGENPWLLCPAHVRVWAKLALGARKTDFVFWEGSGDYLLVELEQANHRLFIKNGHTSSQLNHAVGQILDWKRYIEDNLSTVRRELGLNDISSAPNTLIVIGRSQSLSPENKRKLISFENQSPKLKIMTYDDVYENARAVMENILGPLWDVGGNTQIYYLGSKRKS